MHPPLILQIFSNLFFEWRNIPEHIGVAEHHALRLGSSSRSKNNLERISKRDFHRKKRLSRMLLHRQRQRLGINRWNRIKQRPAFGRTQNESGSHLRRDPPRELRTRGVVDRNHNHSAERASPECCYPLRAVRGPQQHGVALNDLPCLQLARKLGCHLCHSPVAPALAPVAARVNEGALLPKTRKILEIFEERPTVFIPIPITRCHRPMVARYMVPALACKRLVMVAEPLMVSSFTNSVRYATLGRLRSVTAYHARSNPLSPSGRAMILPLATCGATDHAPMNAIPASPA